MEQVTDLYTTNYIVVKMDCVNFNIEVLKCFDKYKDALKYFSESITENKEIENPDWYEKIIDGESNVSVYLRGWITKKSLIYRYFIKSY